MQNSMVVFIASVLRWKYSLWASLVQKMKIVSFSFQKIKTVCWSWNLEPRLIWIFKIWRWFSFYSFLDWKYSFWVNLAQKIKIVSLSWNLVPRLFWIFKIWRWWSFFCFRPSFASFVHKIHLAFWCYLMNLPVVYLQKLEASGFFYLNMCSGFTSFLLKRNIESHRLSIDSMLPLKIKENLVWGGSVLKHFSDNIVSLLFNDKVISLYN